MYRYSITLTDKQMRAQDAMVSLHVNIFATLYQQRSHRRINVVLVRTFFHEQVKRHRLTFFSYHLFKTCNSCPVTQENVTFMLMHQSVESPAPPYPGNAGHQRGILAVFSGHLCPSVRGVRQHQTQITATGDRQRGQRGFGGDFAFEQACKEHWESV